MLRLRHKNACTAVLLMAAVILLPVTPATSATPGNSKAAALQGQTLKRSNNPLWKRLSPNIRSDLTKQIPLVDAATKIEQFIGRGYRNRYGGIAIDIPSNRVLFYWKGSRVPTRIQDFIETLPVRYTIKHTKYAKSELDTAKLALMRTGVATEAITKSDHSGIEATTSSGKHLSQKTIGNVPVETTGNASAAPIDCTPYTPCPPYQGGTFIQVDVGAGLLKGCTTSWRVIDANDNDGLLTAAHCGLSSDSWSATGKVYSAPGDEVATSVPKHAYDIDAMIITGKTYIGRFYDDQWNTSGDWSVTTYRDPIAGQRVCSMGSLSGNDCNWTISDAGCALSYGSNFQNMKGFCTIENGGEFAIGHGDSGGPFYYPGDGVWDTYAVGMETAAKNASNPCWSYSKPDRGNVCANNGFGIPLSRILDEFNLGLLTS